MSARSGCAILIAPKAASDTLAACLDQGSVSVFCKDRHHEQLRLHKVVSVTALLFSCSLTLKSERICTAPDFYVLAISK